ncbi:SRPBCC family protein [Dyadobacter psychrotolerans]|uniref:SRPBCC domain-containing protein n=1 Tax=Dyadobacter psychrotolerans TaxID=2541721 RepID=A0A4V2Z4R0_9BACT|nr:SRPBCC domain-containing protein [Dyadobacter psychrotolerans]TDE17648.1 SRPBCC domain-containing protein [Dyadobacter psychrotolerans]
MGTQIEVICPPDISSRPFNLKLEKHVPLSIENLFKAWTSQLDLWFASPGSLLSKAEPNTAFYFETQHEGRRSPHYGRFLRIEFPGLVELTWITGEGGTEGAETVLTVELNSENDGTLIKLSHAGFADEVSKDKHLEAWPYVLDQMTERRSRPID